MPVLIRCVGAKKPTQTHERELSAIRPVFPSGLSSNGNNGGPGDGGQGSIVDKASARDLLRADVSPMEIDDSITFDSIGGGKVWQGGVLDEESTRMVIQR